MCVVFHWNSNPSCEGLISWSNTYTHTQKPCVCLSEPRFGRANAGAQTQHTQTQKTCVCLSEPRFEKAGYRQHTYLHLYPQTPTSTQTHPHRYTHTDTESFSSV